jgi:hypothetical protein
MDREPLDIIVCYPEKLLSAGFFISLAQSIITLAPPLTLSNHIKLGYGKDLDVSAEATGYKKIPVNKNPNTREKRYRFVNGILTPSTRTQYFDLVHSMLGKRYDFFSVGYFLLKALAFIALILGTAGALKFNMLFILLYFPIGLILKRLGKNTFHCAESSSKVVYELTGFLWFPKFAISMPYIVDLRLQDLCKAGILEEVS